MNEWLLAAAEWWGETALGGGALLLIGCLLMRLTREPAARQRVGEVAVIAALLFAVLRLGPAWLQMPWTPSNASAAVTESATTMPAELGAWVLVAPSTNDISTWTPEATPAPFVASTTAKPMIDWSAVLAASTALYLAIAGLLFLRWIAGQWALARLRNSSRPASWRSRQLFAEMAQGSVWPEPNLGRTRRLRMPVAFGLSRPAVLMPDSFDRASDETRLRWVFAHELTHLRRRDPWSHWMLGLAQAIYFFVPWFWWIKRQVRLCQEYVADEAAARTGRAADEYAEFLVSMAKSPAAPAGAAGMGSSSDLYRRVQMVLQQSSRGPVSGSRSTAWLAGIGLLCSAVLASGITVRAEPPAAKDEKEVIIRLGEPDADVFTFVVTDDDEPVKIKKVEKKSDEKKAEKKDEKKDEKKKVVVVGQDGQIHIVVPIDADEKQIKEKVEKAVAEARKKAEAAKKEGTAARDKARKDAEGAREAAAKQREKAQAEREKAQAEREKAAAGAKKARAALAEKAASGSTSSGGLRLGLSVDSLSAAMADQLDLPKDRGLVVVGVKDDSPAAKAGFKVNDVLVEFAGKPVSTDGQAFAKRVRELKADESFDASVLRKGRKERIKGIKLPEAKSAAGAVWQFNPDGKTFEWKPDAAKNFGNLKDGKFEINLGNVPGRYIDPEKFKGKFEIKLDGLQGADGAKIADEIKKQIELKLAPMKKELDPKKFEQIKKEMDGVKKELEIKLNVDQKRLKEAGKELELKLDMDKRKLQDLHKKLEMEVVPRIKDLHKDGELKKGVEVKVVPAVKGVVTLDDVHKHIAVIADSTKHIDAAKKHIAVLADPAKHIEAAKKHLAVVVDSDDKVEDVKKKIAKASDSELKKSGDKSEKSSTVSVSVTVNDGEFKAVRKEGALEITVVGQVEGKKVAVGEIKIYDGGFKGTYGSVDKVPEKYRDKIKKLIANQEDSPVRFEFQRN